MNNITSQEYLELKFDGNNLKPSGVKAGEIADILKAVEVLVENRVQRDVSGLKKEQVIVGFTNIRSESIDLEFSSPYMETARYAFEDVGRAISENDFSKFTPNSFNALKSISLFTRRQKCTAEFSYQNGTKKRLATITPDTAIERPQPLRGEATVFAKVVRAGGKEPKVEIETIDGRTLFCDAPLELTMQLGSKLYQIVGLVGTAEWDFELSNIVQFSIANIISYEHKPLKDAFEQLRKVTAKYYSEITDVEQHVASLRGNDV